jgi:murein DD-endopeptidase MepM/ murein hydrolase activator NlpD
VEEGTSPRPSSTREHAEVADDAAPASVEASSRRRGASVAPASRRDPHLLDEVLGPAVDAPAALGPSVDELPTDEPPPIEALEDEDDPSSLPASARRLAAGSSPTRPAVARRPPAATLTRAWGSGPAAPSRPSGGAGSSTDEFLPRVDRGRAAVLAALRSTEAEPRPTAAPPPLAPRSTLSPRMTAVFGAMFGLATLASILALLMRAAPPAGDRALASAAVASATASAKAEAQKATTKSAPKKRERVLVPPPWRVRDMKEPGVALITGQTERRTLVDALGEKEVPAAQVYRVLKAFEELKKFDKTGRRDTFTVALDKAQKRIRAFEYQVSPAEIYQAKEDEQGTLRAQRLDLKVAEEEFVTAFWLGKSLEKSARDAGLEEGFVQALDEALSGRTSTERLEPGGHLKVIAVEETMLGAFHRYKKLLAVEYTPPEGSQAKALRVYYFDGREVHGYFDAGAKSSHGGWRAPCPGAPVTSRFNPKRMHPVLKKVMPHNGTDFGAPAGTPVYAAYRGVVSFVGNGGPSGNLVLLQHPSGVETGYAHLSKFAPGIKVGDKIGTRQLVGYVGSTGRSTGPHLHFSAKRDGKFFDAETLKLDGEKVLPPGDRQGFLALKAELDRRLDAIALPDKPSKLDDDAEPAPEPGGEADDGKAGASDDKGAGDKHDGDKKGDKKGGEKRAAALVQREGPQKNAPPPGFTEAAGDDDADDPAPAPKGKAPPPPPDPDEE